MILSAPGRPHLTYCTNVHPGESWDEVDKNLRSYVTAVKSRVAPDRNFGVGLRLSAQAADQLSQPENLSRFQDFLRAAGLYVFTINGFPYGAFHGRRVKEAVYRPDWLEEPRLAYTNVLARLLAALLPKDVPGSISTVPGGFRTRIGSESAVERLVEHLLRHMSFLWQLRGRTGKDIVLALEPEPCCYLETVAETLNFFERHVFGRRATKRLARLTGSSLSESRDFLHQHLTVCLDACHMAVEFEEPDRAVESFQRAGIGIGKIQISAGLQAEVAPGAATLVALRPFANDVYLHQVVEKHGGRRRRWADLPQALDAAKNLSGTREWRIHFHVPLFQERLGPFRNTQEWLRSLLAILRTRPVSPHLEIETYTWQLLPQEFRQGDVVAAVSREIRWVLDQMAL